MFEIRLPVWSGSVHGLPTESVVVLTQDFRFNSSLLWTRSRREALGSWRGGHFGEGQTRPTSFAFVSGNIERAEFGKNCSPPCRSSFLRLGQDWW